MQADPHFATIETFRAMTGIGRSHLYNLLGSGDLRAVKAGRRTLIDVQHGLAWLQSRPAADIRCGRSRG